MKTEFEQILLETAKGYLKSLSDAEFLALTCNLTSLHDGLIRLRARKGQSVKSSSIKSLISRWKSNNRIEKIGEGRWKRLK